MRQLWCTAVYGGLLGVGLISTILPTTIYACSVCGGAEDNGYFWGVLFLMSMPFAIGSFVGGWLLYNYRRAPSDPATSTPTSAAEGRRPQPVSVSSRPPLRPPPRGGRVRAYWGSFFVPSPSGRG
jgi:hypothetical protein